MHKPSKSGPFSANEQQVYSWLIIPSLRVSPHNLPRKLISACCVFNFTLLVITQSLQPQMRTGMWIGKV